MAAPKRRRDSNGSAWRKARARVIAAEDICGLCGLPVDKQLHYLDPMSASVDHIVPFSKGGHAFYRSNLQLTHKVCNQRKSDNEESPEPQIKTSRRWL